MIATKSSICLAPSPQSESLIKGNAPIALADSVVQARAYELYELRGRVDGCTEQDWYEAETDLRAGQTKREV